MSILQRTCDIAEWKCPLPKSRKFIDGLIPRPTTEFLDLTKEELSDYLGFTSAKYSCEYEEEDDVLRGTCELNKAKGLDESRYLDISGSLPIGKPSWKIGSQQRSALVGHFNGQTLVENEPDAESLTFQWSCQARRAGGRMWYRLRCPPALTHELALVLPAHLQVRCNHAITTKEAQTEAVSWVLRWSGHDDIQFVVEPSGTDEKSETSVQLDTVYEFEGKRLVANSHVKFDASSLLIKPKTLIVQADPKLNLAEVMHGEQTLRWSQHGRPGRYVVELPNTWPKSRPIDLKLTLISDFPWSKLFDLPRVQIEGRWVAESVSLKVNDPLEVVDIRTVDARCRTIVSPSNEDVENLEFEFESAFGELQVQIAPKPHELNIQGLIQVDIKEGNVTADVELQFVPFGSPIFDVSVDLASDWTLVDESVDAIANTIDLGISDSVIRQFRIIESDKGNRLSVQFEQAATSKRPVSVRFQLQNSALQNGSPLSDLVPISVPEAERQEIWLHGKETPGLDLLTLQPEHGEWQRLDDDEEELAPWIEARIREVVDPPTTLARRDFLLKNTAGSKLVKLERKAKAALVSVESKSHVYLNEDLAVRYVLDLSVDPLGNEMSSLNLVFSQPIDGEFLPTFQNRNASPTVHLLDPLDGDPPNQARYEVRFETTDEPYQLRLQFEVDANRVWPVPLVTVQGATESRGLVGVFAEGPIGVDVQAEDGLSAVPLPSFQTDNPSQLRAAYSYDTTSPTLPKITVEQSRRNVSATLTAWRCDMRSFFAEKGRPRHRIDYYIQNQGAERLRLTFAKEVVLEDVEVDGERLVPQPRLEDGVLSISLPQSRPFPCVTVRFVEPEKSLRSIDWLRQPLPDSDISVLQSTWQVWLPSDYRTYSPKAESNQTSWLQRMTGPFEGDAFNWLKIAASRIRRRLTPGDYDLSIVLEQNLETVLGQDRLSRRDSLGLQKQNRPMTWGPRLVSVQDALSRSRSDLEILIDREELRRIGIFPDTQLPTSRYVSPRQKAQDRFRQLGLAAVVDEPRVILTTSSEVKERLKNREPIEGIGVLGDINWFGSSRLQSVNQWRASFAQQSSDATKLWQPSPDPLEAGLQRGGWHSQRRILDANDTSWKIYHRDTILAIASSVFFLGYGIGTWLFDRNRRRWFVVLMIAFAVSFVLPQPGMTFAIACVWALLLSGIVQFIAATRTFTLNTTRAPFYPSTTKTKAAVGLILLVSVGIGDQLLAQQSPNSTPAIESDETLQRAEHRVFVPIQEDETPANVVYLSPEFYVRLLEHRSRVEWKPAFLIERATYTGDWPSDRQKDSLRLSVSFQIANLTAKSEFTLPEFGEYSIVPGSLRIDRFPAQTLPNRNSTIQLGQVGLQTVSFDLDVPIDLLSTRHRVTLPIPTIADSKLSLNLPRETEDVEIVNAVGQTDTDLARGVVNANLGPVDELVINVIRSNQANTGSTGITQLSLLRINPTFGELQVRFQGANGKAPVTLQVDTRLTPVKDSLPLASQWNAEDSTLRLSQIDSSKLVRFRMPIRVGKLVLPSVIAVDLDIDHNQFAVVTSPETSVEVSSSDTSSLESEFMDEWPGLEQPPNFVFETGDQRPELLLTSASRAENWTGEMNYFFDALENKFKSNLRFVPLSPEPVPMTVRKLKVPPELDVENVDATNSLGVPLKLRWRRSDDEITLFFLEQPATSSAISTEIHVSGKLSSENTLPIIVPSVTSKDDIAFSQSVRLFRSPDVTLNPDTFGQVTLNLARGDIENHANYKFVGSWVEDYPSLYGEELAFVSFSKQAAQRTLSGSLTTQMNRIQDGWMVTVEAEVSSSDGIIEVIHFDVPESMVTTTPVANDGDGTELRVEQSSGVSLDRRIVSVWLPPSDSANQEDIRTITLECQPSQKQTRLPQVRALNVNTIGQDGQRQQFAELPLASNDPEDDSDFAWTIRGLAPLGSDAMHNRYRVTQRDFGADLEIETTLSPEVFMLETTVGWRSSMEYLAISQFDLGASSTSRVLVQIPKDATLMQVMCDDHPVYHKSVVSPDSLPLFLVSLHAAPWPQRLRVIYKAKADSRLDGSTTVEAPRLLTANDSGTHEAIPIQRELWSIYTDGETGTVSSIGTDAVDLPQDEYDYERILAFSELWSSSEDIIRERPTNEKMIWLSSWVHRLQSIFDQAQRDNSWADDRNLEPIQQLFVDSPEVFDPGYYNKVTLDTRPIQPIDLWNESQWGANRLTRFSTGKRLNQTTEVVRDANKEQLPSLQLKFARSNSNAWATRCLIASFCLSIAFVLPRWESGIQFLKQSLQYPHATAILLGLIWWMTMTPASLGLFAAALVALTWLYGTMRRRRLLRTK